MVLWLFSMDWMKFSFMRRPRLANALCMRFFRYSRHQFGCREADPSTSVGLAEYSSPVEPTISEPFVIRTSSPLQHIRTTYVAMTTGSWSYAHSRRSKYVDFW